MLNNDNNCYCDFCKHRLISKPDHNHLVILPDQYGDNYFCFCSMECALAYWQKMGSMELDGFHSPAMTNELERQIKLTQFWHIRRVNPYQLSLLAQKEVGKHNEKANSH